MASTTSRYTAGEAPPSYDSIVGKIDEAVGSTRTPDKYLEVVKSLSSAEIGVIADGAKDHPPPIYTEEDKKTFAIGAAKAASEDSATKHLETAANKATLAAKEIRGVFQSIELKITEIDQIHMSNFLPELEKHQKTFNDILGDSRLLATDISQYGKSFDGIIVQFCADQTISVDDRIKQIGDYIEKTQKFEDDSTSIKNRFDSLTSDFTKFVGTFGTWAKDKEGELNDQIKELNKEIAELNAKLVKLQKSLMVLGIAAGVGLPALAVAAALSGPFAPFVAIGGLIALGATAASIAGISIAIAVTSNDIKAKQSEKEGLQEQIEQIQHARQELQDLGTQKLKVFTDNVNVLSGYWTATTAQAHEIQAWLKDGASMAKRPKYMQMNLDHGVQIYAALSVFLDNYASGLTSDE
ncbi:hypothetical protein P170DRAFT_359049 [Aspergillus steynii IBT 23096]|uniref:Uncharacterized protein n=1 Tax=Aspergillus steynii IBT 23096 TaxID=1392250 RepID=A0A2I2G749_9EURO|nr:uncharacterized protein P170DRAFT_359049 [Aspergillus steynii IBT 23096]PLB48703.1 hypothetical protein P170DRAFT_359049 [Aspergillus steynii IBT 23096]